MSNLLPLRDEWFATHPRPASKATYERHLRTFIEYCDAEHIQDVDQLTDQVLLQYAPTLLDRYAGASINLKIVAVKDFLGFLEDRDLLAVKWSRLQRQWKRLPRADQHQILLDEEGIEGLIQFSLTMSPQDIREARNFAFIVFLADTGLRVGEACKLKRGDVDWQELHGLVVGKRNKQAAFRISERATRLVQRYLQLRAQADGIQNVPLYRLPLFARHDDAVGNAIRPMSPTTGRNITVAMVLRVLAEKVDPQKPITPHKFRHYLIDSARRKGGLMLAKGLARHESIQTTEKYFHLDDEELDRGYNEMFHPAS
jgi:site-specific recombinase XerD